MPTVPNHSHSARSLPERTSSTTTTHAHDHVRLDAERLDCYQVALQFSAIAARLVPRGHRELRDQLTRASLSIVLNCAEGAGRTSPGDKARFFSIARGSSAECAAVVDVLLSSSITPIGVCREARGLLIRIVQMLTKLEARFRCGAGQ